MLTEKGGFLLGERVVLVSSAPDDNYELSIGDEGIIVELDENSRYLAGVRWDKELTFGHDCGGNCEDFHGWRVYNHEIDHITNLPEIAAESIEVLLSGGAL